jgi:predicted metal-dependent phosphoesterase TrpH
VSVLNVRIDPHVHSDASYDGTDSVELILEQAAEIGLDAVVVTDHDEISESLRAAELAPLYGLVGIPGVEVSTSEGHLLALGVEEMPPTRRPLAETVEWVRDAGGVAIVPHPFQRSRHGVPKRIFAALDDGERPDALEVYNSWLFTGYKNLRAKRFATAHDYPGVAGSDAHTVPFVGRAYTEISLRDVSRANLTADVILDAIRDGDTVVRGRRQPIPVSARHYAIGAARVSGYYAKVGALKSSYYAKRSALRGAYYAKLGAIRGGYYAKLGLLRGLRALAGLTGLPR